jgi:hypothetical protein
MMNIEENSKTKVPERAQENITKIGIKQDKQNKRKKPKRTNGSVRVRK